MSPEIYTLGHDALLIRFAREASEAATACVQVMLRLIEEAGLPHITEIAPALASVMVRFQGGTDVRSLLYQHLTDLIGKTDWSTVRVPAAKRRWIIPVCFDGDAALHLAEVAQIAGKSEAAIIHDLENADVRVLALGFAPASRILLFASSCFRASSSAAFCALLSSSSFCLESIFREIIV